MPQGNVLIVDDDPASLLLFSDLLLKEGYAVRKAASGANALACLGSFLPNLILIDLKLPDMDGFALLNSIRSDERLRQVPVVALTSYTMKGDREKAISAGFSGYITKPIDIRRFREGINNLLKPEGGNNAAS